MDEATWCRFRPCIDLHEGQVKQIVGGTLSDNAPDRLHTNFVASQDAAYFAQLYREHNLMGAHVIKLGPNNDDAARRALQAWPDGLQIGGGIDLNNAQQWIDAGAAKVIVTSYLFPNAVYDDDRLRRISELIGSNRLVVDLSCRTVGSSWRVAMNKWQTITNTEVNEETLRTMAEFCSEFLIHAADVEGLCRGIDVQLVQALGKWTRIPCTYAGGANNVADLDLVNCLTNGRVDLTFGSALDIFGGKTVKFQDCVAWNRFGKLPTICN